jgi:hypothetical protein
MIVTNSDGVWTTTAKGRTMRTAPAAAEQAEYWIDKEDSVTDVPDNIRETTEKDK